MQHFPKEKVVLALVVSSVILFAFMLLVTTNTIANVSALELYNVGVFWDSNCSNNVSSINWGILTPGSVKNIVVYVRNEVEEPKYLIMSTSERAEWDPPKAFSYISLRWDYAGQRLNPGEILRVTLTLLVSRSIEGISSFSFGITIAGIQNLPGDINADGIVDSTDNGLFSLAYGSIVGDRNYNANCDFNNDGAIDSTDDGAFGIYWGMGG